MKWGIPVDSGQLESTIPCLKADRPSEDGQMGNPGRSLFVTFGGRMTMRFVGMSRGIVVLVLLSWIVGVVALTGCAAPDGNCSVTPKYSDSQQEHNDAAAEYESATPALAKTQTQANFHGGCSAPAVGAETEKPVALPLDKWALMVYGGIGTDGGIEDFPELRPHFNDAYLLTVACSREVARSVGVRGRRPGRAVFQETG